MLWLELLLVLGLVLLNGFLAMSELAVVSARRARLQTQAQAGHAGAGRALRLIDHPGRFLSSVQIGITLVGVLAGAFSGATIAERLGRALIEAGVSPAVSDTVAFVIVVAAITYLSLILGELVPKQLALRNAESIAARVALPMTLIARVAAPAVWLLDISSRAVLMLMGSRHRAQSVTEEDLTSFIAEAETAGVVEPAEKRMLAGVMRLGDRQVGALMTPRTEVEWIDLEQGETDIRRALRETAHSRLPVSRGTIDEVVGIVQAKDALDALLDGREFELQSVVRDAPVVHDGADALDVIEVLRASSVHMALVVDEYGSFEGVVTLSDILEAIVGSFQAPGEEEPLAVQREDGSWLLDGSMPCDEMAATLGVRITAEGSFHTVAGFVLACLRRLPKIGEAFEHSGWRFEVVDMDGRRIDRVLASRPVVLHRR